MFPYLLHVHMQNLMNSTKTLQLIPLSHFIGYFDDSLGFYKEEINANSHLKQPN